VTALLSFRLVYLYLGVGYTVLALLGWWRLPACRTAILAAGAFGAGVEALAEVAYLRGYWHPVTLLPWPTPEDLLFGFGLSGLTVAITRLITGWRPPSVHVPPGQAPWLSGLLVIGIVGLIMSSIIPGFHVSSIWTAVLVFAIAGLLVGAFNPDPLVAGLVTGLIMAVVSTAIYAVALDVVIDGRAYLQQVYLPYGTTGGHLVFGNVPLDLIVWNATRGFAVSMLIINAGHWTLGRQNSAARV
jgi:hypothetical protein